MTQPKHIAQALNGAYFEGRRRESQEVKAFIAHVIRGHQQRGRRQSAEALQAVLISLSEREHSPIAIPPPGDNQ